MTFNILIIGQKGRLQNEAALFAATLRHASPRFSGRLIVAEPMGPLWADDPRVPTGPQRSLLEHLDAEFVQFENKHFGASYPNGNKIEALAAMPPGPFLFFDTDTVITGELADLEIDFSRPAASMNRENTWPAPSLYGPNINAMWRDLHERRDGRLEETILEDWPVNHWQRYLYFNAGWFFGDDPQTFYRAFLDAALMIRDCPPKSIENQELNPWLDQAALPLTIHELGGGRPGAKGGIEDEVFDASHSFHYRYIPLLYATAPDHVVETVEAATASNRIKKVLKRHEPFLRFLYQGKGERARALFDRTDLPRRQHVIRNRLRRANLWMR